MRDLAKIIPDADVIYSMEPEELAAQLIVILQKRIENGERFLNCNNCVNECASVGNDGQTPFPREKLDDLQIAITEAWAWLEAQGLLIPAEGTNGSNGFRILSRRARKFSHAGDVERFRQSRQLPKEILHDRIASKVWSAFLRGEYDVAVFQALKGVEVYVREVGGFGQDIVGVKLMQEAFKSEGGVLTDAEAEAGERLGRMQLFCGAIASYKNAGSHRDVDLNDPMEATEIIHLANHLMRVVDARASALSRQ